MRTRSSPSVRRARRGCGAGVRRASAHRWPAAPADGAVVGGGCGAGAAIARSTSAFVTRGPSALTAASSTSCSRAVLRADGVAAHGRTSGARGRPDFSVHAGLRCSPGPPRRCSLARPRLRPRSRQSSRARRRSSRPPRRHARSSRARPRCGAATSTSTLSVSSSTSGSPAATASPSFFSQRATRASTIDSPTSGTTMFTAIVCSEGFAPRTLHARLRGPICPAPLAWLTRAARSRYFSTF